MVEKCKQLKNQLWMAQGGKHVVIVEYCYVTQD
jgi:hypothetical protein